MTSIRPKDAATLIVLRRDPDGIRVLMGERSEAHAFMPGALVFPGGRVERSDHLGPARDELHSAVAEKLLRSVGRFAPSRARALALAAIRETFEETGVLVGHPGPSPASVRGPWRAILQHGVIPALAPLRLVARAITPPRHIRRFDARFFAVFADHVAAHVARVDGELQSVAWLTPDEARTRPLPEITRMVLEHLEDRLRQDPELDPHQPVPFFHVRRGRRCVEEL